MRPKTPIPFLLMLAALGACNPDRPLPLPIFEPSSWMQRPEARDSTRDLTSCRQTVRDAAPVTIQPRWISPIIAPNGVVLGTVDMPHPAWSSSAAYRQDLTRCLTSRGYDILSWE